MVQQRTHVQHTATFKNQLPKEAVQFKAVADNPSPKVMIENCICSELSRLKLRRISRSG
jgi:hypothetical protein